MEKLFRGVFTPSKAQFQDKNDVVSSQGPKKEDQKNVKDDLVFEDDKVFDEQVFPTSVSKKRASNKPALWRSLYDKVLHETSMG